MNKKGFSCFTSFAELLCLVPGLAITERGSLHGNRRTIILPLNGGVYLLPET